MWGVTKGNGSVFTRASMRQVSEDGSLLVIYRIGCGGVCVCTHVCRVFVYTSLRHPIRLAFFLQNTHVKIQACVCLGIEADPRGLPRHPAGQLLWWGVSSMCRSNVSTVHKIMHVDCQSITGFTLWFPAEETHTHIHCLRLHKLQLNWLNFHLILHPLATNKPGINAQKNNPD